MISANHNSRIWILQDQFEHVMIRADDTSIDFTGRQVGIPTKFHIVLMLLDHFR